MAANYHHLASSTNSLARYLSVLRRFKCPFDVDSHLTLFYSGPCNRPRFCPFGHRWNQSCRTPKSRPVPGFVCIRHLVGQCPEVVSKVRLDVERCCLGYHPTAEQMADLEDYRAMVASVSWQRDHPDEEPADLQCAICLGEIVPGQNRRLGLLENCSHAFCADCLLAWLERDDQKRCPVCRAHSNGMLIWPRIIASEQEKRELFELQNRAHELRNARPSAIDPTDFPNLLIERLQGLAGVQMQVIHLPGSPEARRNAAAAANARQIGDGAGDEEDDEEARRARAARVAAGPELPEEDFAPVRFLMLLINRTNGLAADSNDDDNNNDRQQEQQR